MAWYDRVLPTVRVIAPSIASALGGPLAGIATKTLLDGLGVSSEEEAQKVIANMNPEVMARMREADQRFMLELDKNNIDLKKIEAEDRASARQREIDTRDRTPAIVGYIVILGFFSCIGLLAWHEIPETNNEVFYIILGALAAEFSRVMGYYYGSSTSSRQKDNTQRNLSETLAEMQAKAK